MIEFTKGDMFEVPVDVRVNTVNCKGVMGAGVALAFKNRYPDMFRDYQHACRDGRVRPGALHVWKSLMGEWVINFPTKRDWRDPSRYEDILSGLSALRDYLREQGSVTVALPALGCGHGGLEWNKVAPMIEESLADLEAKVLVFEPADSREAGRTAQDRPTDEQLKSLESLGFRSVEISLCHETSGPPSKVLLKGDSSLIARRWIALLPAKDPTDREQSALEAVAGQLAMAAQSVPVALVHATRGTEAVADLFLNHGVPVVLILPFGPLARKAIATISTGNRPAPFAIVSVAPPSAPWAKPILSQSMKLLRNGASSALLSDPSPDWLDDRVLRTWIERPMFYLRYGDLPDAKRLALERTGARPIGRRADTGQPNLTPLLRVPEQTSRGTQQHGNRTQETQETIVIPWAAASASRIRELAEVIEHSPNTDGIITVMIPSRPENEELLGAVRRVLNDEVADSSMAEKPQTMRASGKGI